PPAAATVPWWWSPSPGKRTSRCWSGGARSRAARRRTSVGTSSASGRSRTRRRSADSTATTCHHGGVQVPMHEEPRRFHDGGVPALGRIPAAPADPDQDPRIVLERLTL